MSILDNYFLGISLLTGFLSGIYPSTWFHYGTRTSWIICNQALVAKLYLPYRFSFLDLYHIFVVIVNHRRAYSKLAIHKSFRDEPGDLL